MASRGIQQRRRRRRPPAWLIVPAVILGWFLVQGTIQYLGGSYTKQDIRRDALQLVPANARHVRVNVLVGDGFNPTMSADVSFQMPTGTARQRAALYVATALRDGWKTKTHYNAGTQEHYTTIENGHAYLGIRTDYGLAPRSDELYLTMK